MSRPFIPAPNCASAELIFSINGVTAENQIHVQKGSPFSASDLTALRTVINAWDAATFVSGRNGATTLVRIRTRALDTASSPVEDFSLPTPRPGVISSTNMPANVTWAIKLATGLAGRSFRGRWYLIGITAAVLDGNPNLIAAASAAAYVGFLNTLMANLATGGYTLGVLSYRADNDWRSEALFTPATGWVQVDRNLDSQRRRLTGRGI